MISIGGRLGRAPVATTTASGRSERTSCRSTTVLVTTFTPARSASLARFEAAPPNSTAIGKLLGKKNLSTYSPSRLEEGH